MLSAVELAVVVVETGYGFAGQGAKVMTPAQARREGGRVAGTVAGRGPGNVFRIEFLMLARNLGLNGEAIIHAVGNPGPKPVAVAIFLVLGKSGAGRIVAIGGAENGSRLSG